MAESSVMAPAAPRGGALRRFWDSSVGKKVVMAVTGLLMIAFLISHVASNLSVFTGDPEKLNGYARFLRSFGPLLWVARIGLLALLVLHVTAALQLTRRQADARPEGYRDRQPQVSTFSSRTIRIGGVVLLVFIVYHLLHFTFGTLHPTFEHLRPYENMVSAFQSPVVVAVYVLFMLALGLHLFHGTWSAFRTLGLVRPSSTPLRRRIAGTVAILIYGGFTLIPIGVFLFMSR